MIELIVDRNKVLNVIIERILNDYHTDLFEEKSKVTVIRETKRITGFEAVIYHEAEEEGLRDITPDEVMFVKSKVKEKASL